MAGDASLAAPIAAPVALALPGSAVLSKLP